MSEGRSTGLRVLAWLNLIVSILTTDVIWIRYALQTEINVLALGLGFVILFQGMAVCVVLLVAASTADNLNTVPINIECRDPDTIGSIPAPTALVTQSDEGLEAKESEKKVKSVKEKIKNAKSYDEIVGYYDEIKTSYPLGDSLYQELEGLQRRFNALAGKLSTARGKDEENRIEKERYEIQEKMTWLWKEKVIIDRMVWLSRSK